MLIIDRGWIEDGFEKEKGEGGREGEGAWIRYYKPEGGGLQSGCVFNFHE